MTIPTRVIDLTVDELMGLIRAEIARQDRPAEFLSVQDAASRVGVDPSTIRRWIKAGMPAHRRGRVVRVKMADVEAQLAAPKRPDLHAVVAKAMRKGA